MKTLVTAWHKMYAQGSINPLEACISRKVLQESQHVFNHKIETEGKPVTNQKSSGRCWLFAILNVIRTAFMKQYNLDEFEFSQAYLFFWDKVNFIYYYNNNVYRHCYLYYMKY